MKRFPTLILAGLMAAGMACAANAAPEHLRGTLQNVAAGSITLKANDGATQTLVITPETAFALVAKSSMSAILPESYIGTAAKGSGPNMVALEVVIFPPAMRGAGEGHYTWDPLPDITKPGATSASSMSNGSVSSIVSPPKSASSMTNGSVQTVSTLPGAKQISVVYKGGKQIILVLPATPVVSTRHAHFSDLQPGMHVVVFATGAPGKLSAVYIIAGAEGITPPM